MAINSTSGGTASVQIASSAKNGTATAGTANTITLNSAMSSNNGDCEASPTLAGRLITLTGGTGSGQTRYISSDDGSTVATVHEDWTTNPDNTSVYEISYIVQDAATKTGLSLINKRNSDYSMGKKFEVLSTGFFALLNGASLESEGDQSGSVADFEVQSGGRWDNGYLAGGVPVSGGYLIGTTSAASELFTAFAGSVVNMYDWFFTSVDSSICKFQGDGILQNAKLFSCGYTMDLTGGLTIRNSSMQGKGTVNDTFLIDTDLDVDGWLLVDTDGLISADDSVTETFNVLNTTWIGTGKLLDVNDEKTWEIINPIWSVDESSQNDIAIAGTGTVLWQFSVKMRVQEADGTAIVGATTNIYEATETQALQDGSSPRQTDSNGAVEGLCPNRDYTNNAGTSLTVVSYGGFEFRVHKHTFSPALGVFATGALDGAATLLTDSNITNTNEVTARSSGPSVDPVTETNPFTLLFMDTGVNTLAAGETITGNGGATGVVVEISEGDSVAGKVFLKTRNATAFVQGETLTSSGTWTGNALNVAVFNQDFTWHIDGEAKSFDTLYDWQSAELANTTLSTAWQDVHIWGKSQEPYMFQFSGSGYYTVRNGGEGVFISDRGAGTLDYLTADDGTTWTPSATVTIQVTVLDDDTGLAISTEARVLLYDDATKAIEILNSATNGSGVASTSYDYTTSFDVTGWVRAIDLSGVDYEAENISGQVTAVGLSLTVRLKPK